MVKFADQYETQKIPDWYQYYIDYQELQKRLKEFSRLEQSKQTYKLPGLYYFSAQLLQPVSLSLRIKIDKALKDQFKSSTMTSSKQEKNKLSIISSVMKNSVFKVENQSRLKDSSDEEFSNQRGKSDAIKRKIQVDELTIKFTARRMTHQLDNQDLQTFTHPHLAALYSDDTTMFESKRDSEVSMAGGNDLSFDRP